MEKMSNKQLKRFLSSRNKYFCRFYKEEDYKNFLKQSELFLNYSIKLAPSSLEVMKRKEVLGDRLFTLQLSRICLGIACELLTKAAYLKESYIINKSQNNIKKPIKFSELYQFQNIQADSKINKIFYFIKKQLYGRKYIIQTSTTHSLKFLLHNFYQLFKLKLGKGEFNFHIARGFGLINIWRNQGVHVSVGRFEAIGDDFNVIHNSIRNVYLNIFSDEDFKRVDTILKVR